MKNKKGDIPVTVLVIGVFAICTLAILSFSFIDKKTKEGFTESIEAMIEMNSQIDKYEFYKNVKITSPQELEWYLDLKKGKILVEKENNKGEFIINVTYPVKG